MDDWDCPGCGQPEDYCDCNELADGYVCESCGETPTYRELHQGSCKGCEDCRD